MGWIGPARAPTPITTTNPSGVTTSPYEYEWQIIPQVRIHGLIESLWRRVQTVLQINGGLNRCWICRCVNERLQSCVPLFHQCNKQKHFDKWWSTLWTSSHHKPVEDRYIRVFQPGHRTVTASQTPSNIPDLRRISAQTVHNRFREHGKRSRRPYFGAVLKRQHRRARVRWYSTVRIWDLAKSLVQRLIQVHAWTTRWQSSRLKTP